MSALSPPPLIKGISGSEGGGTGIAAGVIQDVTAPTGNEESRDGSRGERVEVESTAGPSEDRTITRGRGRPEQQPVHPKLATAPCRSSYTQVKTSSSLYRISIPIRTDGRVDTMLLERVGGRSPREPEEALPQLAGEGARPHQHPSQGREGAEEDASRGDGGHDRYKRPREELVSKQNTPAFMSFCQG